jgi:hypothetical protein
MLFPRLRRSQCIRFRQSFLLLDPAVHVWHLAYEPTWVEKLFDQSLAKHLRHDGPELFSDEVFEEDGAHGMLLWDFEGRGNGAIVVAEPHQLEVRGGQDVVLPLVQRREDLVYVAP